MNQQQELIYNDLKTRYNKSTLSKREMANELGISYSTIDGYIAKGYGVPSYRKIGHQRNARVLFSLREVSEYLAAQTVQTA